MDDQTEREHETEGKLVQLLQIKGVKQNRGGSSTSPACDRGRGSGRRTRYDDSRHICQHETTKASTKAFGRGGHSWFGLNLDALRHMDGHVPVALKTRGPRKVTQVQGRGDDDTRGEPVHTDGLSHHILGRAKRKARPEGTRAHLDEYQKLLSEMARDAYQPS